MTVQNKQPSSRIGTSEVDLSGEVPLSCSHHEALEGGRVLYLVIGTCRQNLTEDLSFSWFRVSCHQSVSEGLSWPEQQIPRWPLQQKPQTCA